jgi:protein-tyrosine-phosphatase
MAEIIFRNIAKKHNRKDIIVKSAGIYAEEGMPIMELAKKALLLCGEQVPKKPHKSTRLTIEMQKEFDHVIDTRAYIDPYGAEIEVYIDLCKQLQSACQMLYDKLCKI